MHAENLLVDEGGHGQTVEHVTEYPPESNRVSAFALIIEAVNTIDLGTFVVSTEQEKVLGILYFVAKQKANSLDRLFSAINVVTQEEIVGLGWEATILENS